MVEGSRQGEGPGAHNEVEDVDEAGEARVLASNTHHLGRCPLLASHDVVALEVGQHSPLRNNCNGIVIFRSRAEIGHS